MGALISLGGTQIALPDYARLDLAYTHTTTTATAGAGGSYTYLVGGQAMEIVIAVYAELVTSNSVGSRNMYVAFTDGGGHNLAFAYAPASQAPAGDSTYSFNVSSPTGPSSGLAGTVVNLPVQLLYGGYYAFVSAVDLQAGDEIKNIAVTAIRVPTGPGTEAVSADPLTPTPIAL